MNIVVTILQSCFIFAVTFIMASVGWWITMEPSHQKALGNRLTKALKTVLKYGFTGRLDEEDKITGEK